MFSIEDHVAHFYEWEALGRGHLIWDQPVRPEPPFKPFRRLVTNSRKRSVDDGSEETIFSWLWKDFKNAYEGSASTAQSPDELEEENEPDFVLEVDESDEAIVEIQVLLPEKAVTDPEQAGQFLTSLDQCQYPIAFEIIGKSDSIVLQYAVRATDAPLVQRQLEAHFHTATIISHESNTLKSWAPENPSLIVEMGFGREFMLPIREVTSFAKDPITSVAGAMAGVGKGELAVVQVIFEPLRNPWKDSVRTAITRENGSPFFDADSDFNAFAIHKIEKPLFAVVFRIGVKAADYDRVIDLTTHVASSLKVLNHPSGNELIPLDNELYELDAHLADLQQRKSRRSGMIWNAAELVSIVHPPNTTVRIPKLLREIGKTKCAPSITTDHPLVLGQNVHAGEVRDVTLSDQHRLRHMHIIGTSGSGKSTLLLNLLAQDIHEGRGCGILDPHGDLVDQILRIIPEERLGDVILFDPSDTEFPIGLNILNAHSELEKNLLASDLVSVFKRLSTSWGDQMTTVLRNSILAVLESRVGGTLSDLRRFLVEPDFRNEFLRTVNDDQIVYFWKKEFPMLSGKPQAPLLTRLNTFLGPKTIRYMVSQRENKIHFADIMDSGKIFLAKLSQGALGEENSFLLGSLLVAKFYQIAMSRQAMDASERRPYWLYIDEFHNFTSASMASILTGARKYGLGLCLAHQEMKQIESRDSDVAGSVIANPYVRVCFRLGDEDARKLAKGFSFFEEKDLQNLGVGEAICRIEKSDFDFNLKVPRLSEDAYPIVDQFERIRYLTREQYAVPRREIEERLRKEHEGFFEQEHGVDSKSTSGSVAQRKETRSDPTFDDPVDSGVDSINNEGEMPLSDPDVQELKQKQDKQGASKQTPIKPTSQPGHEEIKEYLINAAEKLDFTIDREVLVLDGKGRVDLVFTRGELKIACEIANTTTDEHEVGNILKCIDAGFSQIFLVSTHPNRLVTIAELFSSQHPDATVDIQFKGPEGLVETLTEIAKSDPVGGNIEKSKPKQQPISLDSSGMSPGDKKKIEQGLMDQLKKNLSVGKKKPNA